MVGVEVVGVEAVVDKHKLQHNTSKELLETLNQAWNSQTEPCS